MQRNSNVTVSQSVKHVDALTIDSEVVDTWCAHSCMVGKHVACVFLIYPMKQSSACGHKHKEVFNCCHHAVAPRKRIATRGVRMLLGTSLNSNTSIAPIQSSSSSSWRLP